MVGHTGRLLARDMQPNSNQLYLIHNLTKPLSSIWVVSLHIEGTTFLDRGSHGQYSDRIGLQINII